MPDVSVYMELCKILGISLNEFIAGKDLEQENVVKASEKNLIQVTKEGKYLRKKLKWIIIALACVCGILGIMLIYSYVKELSAINYIEPLPKESAEVETAQLLSGVDGAYLYDFALDSKWAGLTMELSTEGREWFGRSVTEINSRTNISEKTEQGLLALIYSKDGLRMVPISEIGDNISQNENDYIYYITVTFA